MRPFASKRLFTSVTSLLGLGIASAWVAAQSGPGTGRALLPYEGRLEQNGVAKNGFFDLRVGLFTTDAAGVTSCLDDGSLSGCGVWADEFSGVAVKAGSFSVLLGSGAVPLVDDDFGADALWIGVAVAEPGGAFTVLNGMQRLAAVPYAVRAETSNDLHVAGSLGIGIPNPAVELHVEGGDMRVRGRDNGAEADIAQFYANNLSQGVGIGYDRVAAVGANTDQDLHLMPKGSGGVIVDGPLFARATANIDGANSSYLVDRGRYLVEAHHSGFHPTRRWVSIPESVLVSYCGDEDGCTVRMGMRNWEGPAGNPRTSTSMGPFSFYYGDSINGVHTWRRAETVTAPNASQIWHAVQGVDGDGAVSHVAQDHDCYFTDATYPLGTGAITDAPGMGLLNYDANSGAYSPVCWLVIDD